MINPADYGFSTHQEMLVALQHERDVRALKVDPLRLLNRGVFSQQKQFIWSMHKRRAALCSRRAGKSVAGAAILFRGAIEHPGTIQLYVSLTRKSAKLIMWPTLKVVNERYKLGMTFKESELIAFCPNGSQIHLGGADQANFVDRYRGIAPGSIVIDEAQSFSVHLNELVRDVFEPATMDYDAPIVLLGTPGPILEGMFYEATSEGSAWEVHRWTFRDNRYLPNAAAWLKRLMRDNGWDDTNPTFLREYCGIWTADPDSLIYKFSEERDSFEELPPSISPWEHIIGVDIGFDDHASFSVLAWSEDWPMCFVLRNETYSQQIPSQWAEHILALQAQYKPVATVVDAGGLGKAIVEEFKQRYGIPCKAAEKTEKYTWIALMNSDFKNELLKVHTSCDVLRHQYRILSKDKNGREDPTLPNDACDSTLYAFRHCRHYWYVEPARQVKRFSDEWYDEQEEKLIEEVLGNARKRDAEFMGDDEFI